MFLLLEEKKIYILGHTRKGRETFKLEEKEYLV
jgi:hypothetical protein